MFNFLKKKPAPVPVPRRKWVIYGPAAREIRRLHDVYMGLPTGQGAAARFDYWTYIYETVPDLGRVPVVDAALDAGGGCHDARAVVVFEHPQGTDKNTVFVDEIIIVPRKAQKQRRKDHV